MKNRRAEEIECERKEKKNKPGKGKENEEGREEKRKRRKRREKNDLLVFVFVNLFCERDSFSYGRHITYVDREGVEVVSCNTKVD